MSSIHVEYPQVIDAPADKLYAVIADYHVGHPAITPKPEFKNFVVEQGGVGAGTVVTFDVTVMGQTTHYRDVVTEPEPGRILREVEETLGIDTRFILDPLDSGARTRVTIATDFRQSGGLRGLIERLTYPSISMGFYKRELANLAEYVKSR